MCFGEGKEKLFIYVQNIHCLICVCVCKCDQQKVCSLKMKVITALANYYTADILKKSKYSSMIMRKSVRFVPGEGCGLDRLKSKFVCSWNLWLKVNLCAVEISGKRIQPMCVSNVLNQYLCQFYKIFLYSYMYIEHFYFLYPCKQSLKMV